MKTVYEHEVGGDGAMAGLYIEDGFAVLKIKYPLAKAMDPADKFLDKSIDSIENTIPGDWDKLILEPARAFGHEELKKLVAG